MQIFAFFTFLSFQLSLRDRLQRNPKIPPSIDGHPLRVVTGLYIESLGNFRSAEMVSKFCKQKKIKIFESFDVDLYLYLSWNDPSLKHSEKDFLLVNDPKIRNYIW